MLLSTLSTYNILPCQGNGGHKVLWCPSVKTWIGSHYPKVTNRSTTKRYLHIHIVIAGSSFLSCRRRRTRPSLPLIKMKKTHRLVLQVGGWIMLTTPKTICCEITKGVSVDLTTVHLAMGSEEDLCIFSWNLLSLIRKETTKPVDSQSQYKADIIALQQIRRTRTGFLKKALALYIIVTIE